MRARFWSILAALAAFMIAVSLAGAEPDPHAAAHAPQQAAKASTDHAPAAESAAPTPEEALNRLIEGNERFTSDAVGHPHSDAARRCETFTGGQHPVATILSCADSRAPVELLFDQGIGDLFVVRVAGNVADTDEIGTMEYGAGHLNTPLIVVLGHTKCGAVTAVVQEAKVSPNIAQLVDNIVPAVKEARKRLPGARGDALIQAAIDANVYQSIQDLISRSEEIRHLLAEGKVKVIGAVYDLHIGGVRWLGEHPRQAELLKSPTAGSAEKELLHSPKPAAEHDAAPARAQAKEHEESHATNEHAATPAKEHSAETEQPHTNAQRAPMPHEAGTLKGLMVPAAFLGGAGVVTGTIVHFMNRAKRAQAAAEPAASA